MLLMKRSHWSAYAPRRALTNPQQESAERKLTGWAQLTGTDWIVPLGTIASLPSTRIVARSTLATRLRLRLLATFTVLATTTLLRLPDRVLIASMKPWNL